MFPLLIVASEIGGSVFEDIIKIASELVISKSHDEYSDSKDVAVYDFVSRRESNRFEYAHVKQLVSEFRTFLGDADDEDRWLNDKWFGRSLKRLGLLSHKKRVASGILVLLNVDKAKEKIRIFSKSSKEDLDG